MKSYRDPIVTIMRAQNWARIKGELEGYLETFQDNSPTQRLAIEKHIVKFVESIEKETQ